VSDMIVDGSEVFVREAAALLMVMNVPLTSSVVQATHAYCLIPKPKVSLAKTPLNVTMDCTAGKRHPSLS
jgi:hypothetical protein